MNQIAKIYSSDADMISLISTFVPFALGFIFADATGTPIQVRCAAIKMYDIFFIFLLYVIGLLASVREFSLHTISLSGHMDIGSVQLPV